MSLTERLREAALERARRAGGVDGQPIDAEEIVDLREIERQQRAVVDNRLIPLPALQHRPGLVEGQLPFQDPAPEHSPTPLAGAKETTTNPATDRPMVEDSDPLFEVTDLPTAPCPRCHRTVQRHMLDLFAATEYYSCPDCGHMWQHRRTG